MKKNWWLLLETDFETLNEDLQQHMYRSFYCFAYREIIFSLKDHALAEDIIQEAFLKATARRLQLKNVASGRQWVRQIVQNQMKDFIKNKKNFQCTSLENVDKDDLNCTTQWDTETNFEISFRNKLLHETILELKEGYRIVLSKYYLDEKSYKEIALELEISEQVIAQRLFRARKKLLHQFLKKWNDA
ncbi:RNA polymerase sigma factor [Paenibacillus daejeonensis]|uniref:RNA polymerase sigma factor n=1 Tax=Paenibacillus daejeonensis TaxID=135193 RepID=UPI000369A395|nr:RNA polymerase sigma factor [Paenibacillus daejeonensis]